MIASKIKKVTTQEYYSLTLTLVLMYEIKTEMSMKILVRLELKMYSFLVYNSREHNKAKYVNKTVVETSHSEYKDVLFNKKYFRHSINRIQSKNHSIGT